MIPANLSLAKQKSDWQTIIKTDNAVFQIDVNSLVVDGDLRKI